MNEIKSKAKQFGLKVVMSGTTKDCYSLVCVCGDGGHCNRTFQSNLTKEELAIVVGRLGQ